MNKFRILIAVMSLTLAAFPSGAQLLDDYSHIRGNHYFGWAQDEQTIRREL